VRADVGDEQSVRAMVSECIEVFGSVDILVNNATPVGGPARLEKLGRDQLDAQLAVNYLGSLWAMQAVFPHMKAQRRGRIISMASLNGVNAHRYTTPYNGSKEALRALTRTAAVEWGRYGITCNILCPFASTPPWEMFQKLDPEGARRIVEGNPLRRVGDPEADIGPPAVFLASDEAGYVTGNTIHADAGGHINGVAWEIELPE